jgi:hypothetical protein
MTATLTTERWLIEGLACIYTHKLEFEKPLGEAP